MKPKLFTALILAALPSLGFSQTTYTWTGASLVDATDWTLADNWDVNGVPVESIAGGNFEMHDENKIVIDVSIAPTTNVPVFGGSHNSGDAGDDSTPAIEFVGTGSMSITQQYDVWTNRDSSSDRYIWTVGSGATVTQTGDMKANRHGDGTNRFRVEAGGTLIFEQNLNMSHRPQDNPLRNTIIEMNGGTVNVTGNLGGGGYLYNIGQYKYFEFLAVGSSVNASYGGGQFGSFAAVEASVGPGGAFRSIDPLTVGLEATDNLDGTYTITAVVPPPPNYWTGNGGSTWDDASDNFTLNAATAPLDEGTFAEVKLLPSDKVTFGDEYFYDSTSSAVAQNSLTTASGGVEIANVEFTNNSVNYTVTSPDFDGITGSTKVNMLGSGEVTMLGLHSYTGATSIASGGTLTVGDLTTGNNNINSSAGIVNAGNLNLFNVGATYGNPITNTGALVFNTTASLTCSAALDGAGTVQKLGSGTLTIPIDSIYNGDTTITEGTLRFENQFDSFNVDIASGTTLELHWNSGTLGIRDNKTFTGTGTLLKTGFGNIRFPQETATFALSSGALIDIQEGTLTGSSYADEDWTANLSDLNVAAGALFNGAEGNIRVDAVTGGGEIASGDPASGYVTFALGVDNGSGTFSGFFRDNIAGSRICVLTKEGTGTQTLSGTNTYTGNTNVEDGALTISATGQLVMAPTTPGVNNVIQGSTGLGTINLDGTLYLDLDNADTTLLSSWLLVDDTNLLAANYGATFSVNSSLGAFTEGSPGVWTLDDGIYAWFFDEATGTLTYGTSENARVWTGVGGATWDAATTPNFSNNLPADPLSNVTFDVATATTMAAQFADAYFENGGSTAVTQTSVSIGAGGVSTGIVEFFNSALSFSVDSTDVNGIAGATAVRVRGGGPVTLTGTHATTGDTTIDTGNTLDIGDGTTDGSIANSAIANGGALTFTNSGAVSHDAGISGSGPFEKDGAGTLTLSTATTYTGATTITAGTLVLQGDSESSSFDLSSATTVLNIDYNVAGLLDLGTTTFTGGGTLRKSGVGDVRWGAGGATFSLLSGSLIDVQEGLFTGGSFNNEVWSGNRSDLNVDLGASFSGGEANVEVDVLTGSGTITSGSTLPSYFDLTMGVDDGTGTFDGVLADNSGAGNSGNYRKIGLGTQTLTGMNTYTGNTSVESGTLVVSSTGGLTAVPEASGVNNQIYGAGFGTLDFDGELFLNLTNAETTPLSNWQLVDGFSVVVNIGATFSVNSSEGLFTLSGTEWSLDTGGNLWKFEETTGMLTVEEGTPLPGYAAWLDLYPTLSDTSPGGDPESDGMENLLEYVLNGDPEVSDTEILPSLDVSGSDFVFSFTRRVDSENDTVQTFQYGSDLMGWTDISITEPAGAGVVLGTPVTDPDGDYQTVTVTIAKGAATELFGRLKAEEIPAP